MDADRAVYALNLIAKKTARPIELVDVSFPEQAAFVKDPARFVGAECTRRAGKSNGIGFRLFKKARQYPNAIVPYIALTRESAKNIMWPVFTEINEKYKLGASLTESNLTVTLPNGARIVCFGADMKNFIQRLRGIKCPEAAVDEAQSFGGHLSELIDDILTPAISDYTDGAITLTGTPGPVPAGYYYEACTGLQGYSMHRWQVYQNPYMPGARAFVEDLKRKKGWTDENPTYIREWLGKWVIDLDALVYKFNSTFNTFDKLPQGHDYRRILTIDYGWNDQTAFGITTWSPTLRESYTEWIEGHSEMIPSQIARRVQELREQFKPYEILADTGGLGKSITEEMIRRYSIPIKPAEKTEKLTAISLMNGDFIDRRHYVHSSLKRLHDQYTALVKGDNHLEDPGLPNDLCDAALYGHRRARSYLAKLMEPKHPEGTKRWAESEVKKMEEAELQAFERAQQNDSEWWAQ